MPELTVEIVNKVTNIGAIAEEKAALQTVNPFTSTYGGNLTNQEARYAASQLAIIESQKKTAAVVKETGSEFVTYETKLKNAVIVSGQAGSITEGMARKMSAAGALGITPFTVGLVGATIALGGLVEMSKSFIEIADKDEGAYRDLAQAQKIVNSGGTDLNKVADAYIDKNRRYLPGIYETKEGFAQLARAGFSVSMEQRLMNDAMDIAQAKHISLGDAVTSLIGVYAGNTRALKFLGISQKDVNGLAGEGAGKMDKFKAALHLLEPKIKDAHKDQSDLQQASHNLNIEWQHLADENGPALEGALADIIGKTGDFLDLLRNSDKGSNSPWAAFQNGLIVSISLAEILVNNINEAVAKLPGTRLSPNTGGAPGGRGGKPGYGVPGSSNRGFAPGTSPIGKGGQ